MHIFFGFYFFVWPAEGLFAVVLNVGGIALVYMKPFQVEGFSLKIGGI